MADKPLVSIVLGAYNRLEFIKIVIQNAREEVKNIPHEIIVVDGGSTDGSLEWLVTQKDIITIAQHNRGEWDGKAIMRRPWGYFMNLAFKTAQAPHILMISDDTVFHPNAIQNALDFIETQKQLGKRIGAVPFYFHDVNYEPLHQYKVSGLFGKKFLNHGIYMRDAFAKVGFADEDSFMFYSADVDICYKLIDAGYEILPCPTSFVLHCPYHPLRNTMDRDDVWRKDVTALIHKWEGKLITPGTKLEDVRLEWEWLTFEDHSGLRTIFDDALKHSSQSTSNTPQSAHQQDLEVRIAQIENRLNSVNSSVRYHINITETFQNRFYQELHQAKVLVNLPLHKRMYRTWIIFYPVRWLRQKWSQRGS